jgi:hypothetical protein
MTLLPVSKSQWLMMITMLWLYKGVFFNVCAPFEFKVLAWKQH